MKLSKILAALLSAAIFTAAPLGIAQIHCGESISAASSTTGLIEKCSISCSGDSSVLKIQAKTQASGVMDSIGFRNVTIQMSSNGSNWTDVADLGDFSKVSKKFYTLECTYNVTETGLYRVVCTHFATGKTFPDNETDTQTAENMSRECFMYAVKPIGTTIPVTTTRKSTTTKTTQSVSGTTSARSSRTSASSVTVTSALSVKGTLISSAKATSAYSTKITSASTAGSSGESPATGDNGVIPAMLTLAAAVSSAVILLRRKDNN